MTVRLVLYGAGALAREIVDALQRLNAHGTAIELQASIVDPGIDAQETFRGRPVVRDVRSLAGDASLRFVYLRYVPSLQVSALVDIGSGFSKHLERVASFSDGCVSLVL